MTSFGYRLNPRFTIKECSSCGALYTRNCSCLKGSVEDKILVPKLPKNYARCAKCRHPINGPYCQGCALLREKIKKDLVSCLKYFQDTFESSDDSTNVINAPREPFVVKQDHGVKSSQNPPHIDECCCECGNALDGIFCQQCIYVSEKIFSNPLFEEEIISIKKNQHHFNVESDLVESMLNRDSSIISSSSKIDSILDEFAGELTLLKLISPGIDKTECHPENEIRLSQKLLYDNSSPRPPKEFNSKNSNAEIESVSPSPIPNEDIDSFIEELDLFLTLDDPMPPSIEDDDNDSEGDNLFLERLLHDDPVPLPDTLDFLNVVRVFLPFFTYPSSVIHQPPQELSIQEMEDLKQQYLDELKRLSNLEYRDEIKIAELIKNLNGLVPIPSESEGIPEHKCDVPFHDNSPPLDVSKDQIEDFSESKNEVSLIDDDSFSIDNIDYVEASPPNSELVSSE
nr:hypothetical protein [Tanacetum cinerariifolium]